MVMVTCSFDDVEDDGHSNANVDDARSDANVYAWRIRSYCGSRCL